MGINNHYKINMSEYRTDSTNNTSIQYIQVILKSLEEKLDTICYNNSYFDNAIWYLDENKSELSNPATISDMKLKLNDILKSNIFLTEEFNKFNNNIKTLMKK